jgi:hypothetical protein
MDLTMMERVGDRWGKNGRSCSTGQSPQWAVVPVEEGGEEEEDIYACIFCMLWFNYVFLLLCLCIFIVPAGTLRLP